MPHLPKQWLQIESAEIKLEQLHFLLSLVCNQYIDIPAEDFATAARYHHHGMCSLMSLVMETLCESQRLVSDAFADAQKEQPG